MTPGEAARCTGRKTRLNFGETASGPIGGHKSEASDPSGIVAARASSVEGLRLGTGMY